MIYRVPKDWIEQRRRSSWMGATLFLLLGVSLAIVILSGRVDWSNPQDRYSAMLVSSVVLLALLVGAAAGRFTFRNTMRRWESFSVQLTPNALIRQMDGQQTQIERANVTSIREYPRRGVVVTDKLGWRIFVPKVIRDYNDFREHILAWQNKSKSSAAPTAEGMR